MSLLRSRAAKQPEHGDQLGGEAETSAGKGAVGQQLSDGADAGAFGWRPTGQAVLFDSAR
jgi:hypothetical protein